MLISRPVVDSVNCDRVQGVQHFSHIMHFNERNHYEVLQKIDYSLYYLTFECCFSTYVSLKHVRPYLMKLINTICLELHHYSLGYPAKSS